MYELGQPVPRARNQTKQLRAAENKVEYLRNEKQQQRLAKVSVDTNDCERHAGKVAERIAREDARRIPTLLLGLNRISGMPFRLTSCATATQCIHRSGAA